jgi:transposase
MAKLDPKETTLRAQGALNPRPTEVADELFERSEFFDARDLVQVKYEMLRRVRVEGRSVTGAVVAFGFSRPSYYQARESFERGGLPGLIPKKRGPKGGHKLTDTVLDFIEPIFIEQPSLEWAALVDRLESRFGLRVHPRSVERALARRRAERHEEKKGRR